MIRPIHRAALVGLLAAAFAAPTLAQDAASPQTQGLSVDWSTLLRLRPQIPQLAGYTLRLRRLTLAPGGLVGHHEHTTAPAVIDLLSGEIVEHRDGAPEIIRRAGEFWAEDASVAHWIENRGNEPAALIVADVVPNQ
jgi:quercetin dioxygenase-like cupin family protein